MKKIIAVIPARGGSKRIPKKNIKEFHGKPLIAYSIETALKSEIFDKVIVSTDDEKIAEVAKKYGAEVPFLRPKELSDDFTGTEAVTNHAIEFFKNQGFNYEYVCTIYATAPFLQVEYLKKGYEELKNSDAVYSFSATTMPYPIWRSFGIENGRCKMFFPENYNKRSQDLEEAYHDAGQFYFQKLTKKSNDILFGKDSIPILLPRYLVQDIDTMEDWKRAELMFEGLKRDKFDEWNILKKTLNDKKSIINFYNGNIYFMSVGRNIGYEIYGKGDIFLRPVLVYKKLSKTTFLGIPLTSKEKEGSYFFKFSYKKNKLSVAMLNQIRVFDIRRSEYLSGKINKNTYKNLELKLQEFLKITPTKGNANEG